MSAPVAHGLTYDDLQAMPDDRLRRELIDGELYVTPSPARRHQRVVARIASSLLAWLDEHGGEVLPAPADVYFAHDTVVQPDVVFIGPERLGELTDERYVDVVPDLVVEVSSPTTRRLDLIKKRGLYERVGVREYWFVDLEAEQVDVHRLQEGRYGTPTSLGAGAVLTCLGAPGLELPVEVVLRS